MAAAFLWFMVESETILSVDYFPPIPFYEIMFKEVWILSSIHASDLFAPRPFIFTYVIEAQKKSGGCRDQTLIQYQD